MEKLDRYEINKEMPPDVRASIISMIRLMETHGCADFTLQFCVAQRMQQMYLLGNTNGIREAQVVALATINKLGHTQKGGR